MIFACRACLKRLAIFLVFAVLGLCMGGAMAETEAGFSYSVFGDNAKITGYSGSAAVLEIPATLGGYPVTEVGDFAFSGCSSLTEITIPDSVTTIGSSAFSECSLLKEINMPDSITSIGYYAFENCASLAKVVIPEGVSSIGWGTFGGCTGLTEIIIPDGLTSIGSWAFIDCSSLTQINIPDSVSKIGTMAFSGCTGITQITLPDNLGLINDQAFYGCSSLTELVIPESVVSIGNQAFADCSSLVQVTLPDNIASVDSSAFAGCPCILYADCSSDTALALCNAGHSIRDPLAPMLTMKVSESEGKREVVVTGSDEGVVSVDIPDSVTSIGSAAFDGRESLRQISIPKSVKVIGDHAFFSCTALSEVSIEEGVTTIGAFAFYGCEQLKSISLPQSVDVIGESAFLMCSNLFLLNLPAQASSIGESAFYSCAALEVLAIPEGVTVLPADMTMYCYALTSIILPRSVESIASTAVYSTVTTVYCCQGSYAETWAKNTDRTIIYLNETEPEKNVAFIGKTELRADHGTQADWRSMAALINVPIGKTYTLSCESSDESVVSVSGDIITLHNPGTAELTVSVNELPHITHTIDITAYNPVAGFTLPSAVFVPIGPSGTVTLRPENITPENANPLFDWLNNDYLYGTAEAWSFNIISIPYVYDVVAAAQSGVTRTCKIVNYERIGSLRVEPFTTGVPLGSTVQPGVILFLDSVAYPNEPALYTLSSSDESVAKPTADGKLLATGMGTATITVTALGGQTAQQTITVVTPVTFTLPAALRVIGPEAFAKTPAHIITLPQGCETIGTRAFADSPALAQVIIPASVTDIADDAFSGSANVTIVAPEGSAAHDYAVNGGFGWQAE